MAMVRPCILVCALDPQSGICVGCGRTGDEIGSWTSMTEAQRIALMQLLPARLKTLGPVDPPQQENAQPC